jgi:hypothetical protein
MQNVCKIIGTPSIIITSHIGLKTRQKVQNLEAKYFGIVYTLFISLVDSYGLHLPNDTPSADMADGFCEMALPPPT